MSDWQFICGDAVDALQKIDDNSARCCVTSPPYWGLRDYDVNGQIGREECSDEYVDRLVGVFDEVARVLSEDGTLWLNLGDSYATRGGSGPQGDTGDRSDRTHTASGATEKMSPSLKRKDLVGIPWRVAFALRDSGWYLRSDIIWHKPNPMPESVEDRPTSAHEHIFLLSQSEQYFYDHEAIKVGATGRPPGNTRPTKAGRAFRSGDDEHKTAENLHKIDGRDKKNRRDVWTVPPEPFLEAHFAVYPPDLIEPCILAGSNEGDTVIDPFAGAGTTGVVSVRYNRDFIGIDLNREYIDIARDRVASEEERLGEATPDTDKKQGITQMGLLGECDG